MNLITIRERLERAVEEKVFPGAVVGIADSAGTRQFVSAGRFTYDTQSPEVRDDTMYDVASITKTIPVALTALTFIEQGKLGLDDRIVEYLPELTMEHAEEGRIRHLLTYTYVLQKNLSPTFTYEHMHANDVLSFLYTRPFAFFPGTKYEYSNTPTNVLGLVLERISGKKLHALGKEIILDPLRMSRATFRPQSKQQIPPTEITSWRGEIQGEVHDETAFIMERDGFDPGCAGLFSDADDLLNAAEMVFNRGQFRGVRILKEDTIDLMTQNALADIHEWSGVGWEMNRPRFMGKYAHEGMIGKTGFTGTSIVIDPSRGCAVVLLSNRTYPARNETGAISGVRADIADLVFAS